MYLNRTVYNLSKPGERGFCTITIHTVCKDNCVVLEEVHTILLSSTVRKTKERGKLGGGVEIWTQIR